MTTGPPAGHVPGFVLGCVLACAAYLTAATALRRRGDAWPWRRDAAFAAGCVTLVWGLLGRPPGEP
ncbi:cytochrome c oxidase assembly protein, partial [Streptomyces sp. TRM76130]|nr:cytochrome c oxidase assembly protein [Streptomyces sp. TRM76130]